MDNRVRELLQMNKDLTRLKKCTQSVHNEYNILMLQMDIIKLENEIRLDLIGKYKFLVDTYMKTGLAKIMNDDGMIRYADVQRTGDSLQDFFNLRCEIRTLCNWSVGYNII